MIAAGDYFRVFILTMAVCCMLFASSYLSSGNSEMQEKGYRNTFIAFLICLFLVFWMGMRPISPAFGDTMSYSHGYKQLGKKTAEVAMDWGSEWIWNLLTQTSYKIGLSVSEYFTLIESLYIFSVFIAVRILMPKNVLMAMLFVFVSFQFFTFGVNGLRNGLACHLILLAFALYLSDKQIIGILLIIIAFGIHRSIILPVMSFFASIYILKNPKYAVWIWLASIPASLFSGYYFVNLFSNLGFDDRMTQYLSVEGGNALETSTSAFRWDFLLYSSMPVLMFWIVSVKRQITDNWYNVLGSTYCLANAFWVLVIRASFSNRFAYLSWFLYPIIIAYPIIMLPVWEDQDSKTGTVLIAYSFLTLGICYFTQMI